MRLSLPAGAQEALVLENGTVGYGSGLENLITGVTLTAGLTLVHFSAQLERFS
jgi:hypothetical protein